MAASCLVWKLLAKKETPLCMGSYGHSREHPQYLVTFISLGFNLTQKSLQRNERATPDYSNGVKKLFLDIIVSKIYEIFLVHLILAILTYFDLW